MSGIWSEYVSILTDPAHSLVEFTFVAVDYLIVQTAVHALKRHFHRDIETEHQRLDREHGVEHGPKVAPDHPALLRQRPMVLRDGVLWYGDLKVATVAREEDTSGYGDDATDPYADESDLEFGPEADDTYDDLGPHDERESTYR